MSLLQNQLKQKLLRRDPSVSFRFYVHALRYSAKLCDFSGPRALSALSLDSSASGAFSETVADSRRKKKANGKEQGMRRKNEKGKAAGRTDQSKKTGRGRKKKSCDAVDPASEAYTPEVFQPVQIGSRSGSGDDKATTSQPQSAEQDLSRESLRGLESNPCPRNVSSRTSRPNSPAPTASVFHRLPSAPATVGGLPVVHVQSPSATESDGSLGHQQAHQDFIAEDSSESDPCKFCVPRCLLLQLTVSIRHSDQIRVTTVNTRTWIHFLPEFCAASLRHSAFTLLFLL